MCPWRKSVFAKCEIIDLSSVSNEYAYSGIEEFLKNKEFHIPEYAMSYVTVIWVQFSLHCLNLPTPFQISGH